MKNIHVERKRLLELAGVHLTETVWYSSEEFKNEITSVLQRALSVLETYADADQRPVQKSINDITEILNDLR